MFNSGVLAAPNPESTFDYLPVAHDRLAAGGARSHDVCERHGTSLPAAALQFVARPARGSRTVLIGARNASEIADDVELARSPIPDALWADLGADGLVPDR